MGTDYYLLDVSKKEKFELTRAAWGNVLPYGEQNAFAFNALIKDVDNLALLCAQADREGHYSSGEKKTDDEQLEVGRRHANKIWAWANGRKVVLVNDDCDHVTALGGKKIRLVDFKTTGSSYG